jgi:hypothetical protein
MCIAVRVWLRQPSLSATPAQLSYPTSNGRSPVSTRVLAPCPMLYLKLSPEPIRSDSKGKGFEQYSNRMGLGLVVGLSGRAPT